MDAYSCWKLVLGVVRTGEEKAVENEVDKVSECREALRDIDSHATSLVAIGGIPDSFSDNSLPTSTPEADTQLSLPLLPCLSCPALFPIPLSRPTDSSASWFASGALALIMACVIAAKLALYGSAPVASLVGSLPRNPILKSVDRDRDREKEKTERQERIMRHGERRRRFMF